MNHTDTSLRTVYVH